MPKKTNDSNLVTVFKKELFTYHPETELIKILGDSWCIRDAIEGVQIFGGTGSGKTSGSGMVLAKTYIYNGFGGLVLTVKAGDCEMWQQYTKSLGKEKKLVVVSPSTEQRFNFLNYLIKEEYNTVNIAHVFLSALQKFNEGDYWQNAMEQLIKNAICVLVLANGKLSIQEMYKLVMSAPRNPAEANMIFDSESKETYKDEKGKEQKVTTNQKYFRDIIAKIYTKINPNEDVEISQYQKNLINEYKDLSLNYWSAEFPQMDSEPRSSIISMFTSLADNLLRGELKDILSSDLGDTFYPELTFEGSIIVLDLNIKQFRKTGKMAQLIFKTVFQMAVEFKRENQPNKDTIPPIFLWIDEAQFFLTQDDVLFQTTARSSKVCSVYLTQNYSNYLAFVGSNREKATVDSFLAVLQTKFFHCQSDPETNNEYVTKILGKDYVTKQSVNINRSENPTNSISVQSVLDYKVLPWELDQLAKGGKANNLIVEAFVYQSGRKWSGSNSNFGLVSFLQEGGVE